MTTETASPPEGGQGAEGATLVSPPAAPPAPPPPPPAWYADIESPELRGYAETKGWKNKDQAIESYRNLERLKNVPAERIATLPEDWENPDQVKAFLDKLPESMRAPAEAGGYGFSTLDGIDPERAKVLEGLALKHGVPTKMAKGIMSELAELDRAAIAAEEARTAEEVAAERGKLEAEIGSGKWDGFLETARRAARRFGIDEAGMEAIETNIGYAKTMRFFNAVGQAMGEADMVMGDRKDTFAITPDAARTQRTALMNDPEFSKRYLNGGVAEREKIERLNRIISTGGPA